MRNIFSQIMNIGFYSIAIVALSSFFAGFAIVLQSFYAFNKTGVEGYIGSILILSMTRELGPVFTGMILSSRIGGSIAAEIGSMKVTEQIDALKMLNVNVISYLISPRIVAGLIAAPILAIISSIVGFAGGYFCILYLNLSPYAYVSDVLETMSTVDVTVGIVKLLSFVTVTIIISTLRGLNTQFGANGVGFSVTHTVILSSVSILVLNCFYTWLFLDI